MEDQVKAIRLQAASKRYYTLIPHAVCRPRWQDFLHVTPSLTPFPSPLQGGSVASLPTIDNEALLKRKTSMLEDLLDLEASASLIKQVVRVCREVPP